MSVNSTKNSQNTQPPNTMDVEMQPIHPRFLEINIENVAREMLELGSQHIRTMPGQALHSKDK